jgi:lipopolysaccharide export system permease protein
MIGFDLLPRHVTRITGLAMLGSAFLLVFLFAMFTYLAELGELKGSYGAWQALQYVLWQSPGYLYQLLPIAGLMGALLGLGSLASNSELIVMRSAGISLWRIVRWSLRPALLLIVLSFALSEWVLPTTNQQATLIRQQAGKSSIGKVEGYWTREGERYIYIGYADTLGQLKNIRMIDLDQNKRLQQITYAETGVFLKEQQWQLKQVRQMLIRPDGSAHMQQAPEILVKLALQPRFVRIVTVDPEDLSPSQLVEYMNYLANSSQVPKPYSLAFWQKMVSPFALISLVVIACSFIFGPLRQQSVGFRLVIALFVGLGFYYLQKFLGYASLIYDPSPLWFVLFPVVTCFAIGMYLLQRVK